jgi:predicted dehydrogenase
MYKAAIIGCGKIGSEYADDPRITDIYTHAGAYTACPDTGLVAVCDMDPERAERCRKRWDVPAAFTDYRKMMDTVKPEIVSVCTPDETHAAILRDILAIPGVKAVFCEKPLAMDIRNAEEIVARAAKNAIPLTVNYSRRYAEQLFEIHESLAAGSIGTIHTVNGYYTKGTIHNGTHWFDLARFLVGEIRG